MTSRLSSMPYVQLLIVRTVMPSVSFLQSLGGIENIISRDTHFSWFQ